ncbi:CBS domain-containing protein, partial [Pseudomonas sp. BGM005]|nr:CBS domain-containing protein [Pseudomonas sp. BG5]
MLVQATMTSPAITVTASASVAEAARLMLDN